MEDSDDQAGGTHAQLWELSPTEINRLNPFRSVTLFEPINHTVATRYPLTLISQICISIYYRDGPLKPDNQDSSDEKSYEGTLGKLLLSKFW